MEGPWKEALSHPLPPLPDGVEGCLGAVGARGALGQGHLVGLLREPEPPADAVEHVGLSQHPFPWRERAENMKIKGINISLRSLQKITWRHDHRGEVFIYWQSNKAFLIME